jgi:hypothetical protein
MNDTPKPGAAGAPLIPRVGDLLADLAEALEGRGRFSQSHAFLAGRRVIYWLDLHRHFFPSDLERASRAGGPATTPLELDPKAPSLSLDFPGGASPSVGADALAIAEEAIRSIVKVARAEPSGSVLDTIYGIGRDYFDAKRARAAPPGTTPLDDFLGPDNIRRDPGAPPGTTTARDDEWNAALEAALHVVSEAEIDCHEDGDAHGAWRLHGVWDTLSALRRARSAK